MTDGSMLSYLSSGRIGWRIRSDTSEKPSESTIEVVQLLFAYQEQVPTAPHESQTREGLLRGTIERVTIKIGWFTGIITDPFRPKGAKSSSLGKSSFRVPALQETMMEAQETARLRAELEALRELSKEKPLSPERAQSLVEKRKREFDAAWKIDPQSPTDYTPIKFEK